MERAMVAQFESWAGDDEEPVSVRVDHFKPAVPGRDWGPWEDCYPDEPEELCFTVLKADGTEYLALTEKENARIYQECIEQLESMEEPA